MAITATLLAVACAPPEGPSLSLEGVAPDRVMAGETLQLAINGSFSPLVRVSYGDPSRNTVDSLFRAEIGGLALDEMTYIDSARLEATLSAGLAVGVHDLRVVDPSGAEASLANAFTVEEPVVTDQRISIEDAPGGAGAEVGEVGLRRGQTLQLFAVARRADGSCAGDLAVTWSIDGAAGALAPTGGATTTLDATELGQCTVRAELAGYTADETGIIQVTTCTGDGECVDGCHAAATCSGGTCAMGAADRDGDGDGAVDGLCPGGTDCDDARPHCDTDCIDADSDDHCVGHDCDDSAATGATCFDGCAVYYRDDDGDGFGVGADSLSACQAPAGYAAAEGDCADLPAADPDCGGLGGALCFPGAIEVCDSADNDCDGATVDGSGETGVGEVCTGITTASCGDGSLTCDGVALSCSGGDSCDAKSMSAPTAATSATPTRPAAIAMAATTATVSPATPATASPARPTPAAP